MPSTSQITKFLYSQYFYSGLRSAIGISLPVLVCLLFFKNHHAMGFTMAVGALGVCAIDMPGPLKDKTYEMVFASLLGCFATILVGLAAVKLWLLWLTLVSLTFFLSLFVIYGQRWIQVSFATLFMMITALYNSANTTEAFYNALYMMIGGLGYTFWAVLLSKWLVTRIEQQSLAENIYHYATYLIARSNFYETNQDIIQCYTQLINSQIEAVDAEEITRSIILRNLKPYRQGKLSQKRMMLFNLFMKSVDLHELFVGKHTDFALLRATFSNSDLMLFFRDLIRKSATQLEEIALAIMQNRAPLNNVSFKAELRAIEYEIEILKRQNYPTVHPEAYGAVISTFRRIWGAIRLTESMLDQLIKPAAPKSIPDETVARLISQDTVRFKQLLEGLKPSSPTFKHALRVSLAVAVGFWIGPLLPLANTYWITMTIIIILKPVYSTTKQRNKERIIGTLIGCAMAAVFIYSINNIWILILLMFLFMILSYSFQLFHYTVSVIFTSAYVLFMIHLLAPGDLRIIAERALDTIIGCFIALIISRLLPFWEYRTMGHLVKKTIARMHEYFNAAWQNIQTHHHQSLNDLQESFDYLNARKEYFISFAELGQALQRMMIEPKAKQLYATEVSQILMQSYIFNSQISAFLIGLSHFENHELARSFKFIEIFNFIQTELNNIEKGIAPSPEKAEYLLEIHNQFAHSLSQIEQSKTISNDISQEIKLFIYQSKQMLSSLEIIQKNAYLIELTQHPQS